MTLSDTRLKKVLFSLLKNAEYAVYYLLSIFLFKHEHTIKT